MVGLLCNWFDDWGRSIKAGLGNGGLIALLVVFSIIAFVLVWGIVRSALVKSKFAFAWGYAFLLVIFILFIIWFSTLL